MLSRAAADAALAMNQDSADAHNARGFVMQETGDQQSAIREMKTALALDPGNPRRSYGKLSSTRISTSGRWRRIVCVVRCDSARTIGLRIMS